MPLFTFDEPTDFNACISVYGADFSTIAYGFKEAAELALEGAINHPSEVDPLAFPILYLYRHHLEIRLKQLMAISNYLSGRKPDFDDGHDLKALWGLITIPAQRLSPGWFEENSAVVESAITEFHDVDKLSTTFRYTVGKKPKPKQALVTGKHERENLVKDIYHINLLTFQREITPVVSALELLSEIFQELAANHEETQLEYEVE